jgi:hypothetical protein
VTLSGLSLTGGDAANYELDLAAGLTGDVNPKAVTIATLDADDKVFDGTADATVSNDTLSGVLTGDNVSLSTTGATLAFADANAGNGKSVMATGLSLSGSEAANYVLTGTVPAMAADISQKAVTITGLAITAKEYDGNNTATLGGTPVLSGMITGATVLLNDSGVAASFADKNIGAGKPVAVSGYTLGNGSTLAVNYILRQPTGITGDITAKALTVTGATVADRAYDGTTDAPVNGGGLSGVILSEDVQLRALAAYYGDANVGNAKPVVSTGFSLTGTDIGNYVLTQVNLSGRVTAKNAYVSGVTAVSRVYDRTTNASLSGTAILTGLISGEVLTLDTNAATAGFADWEVGTNKPVTVTGYAVTGTTAANYTVVQPSLTADITQKLLPLSGLSSLTKEYDGTTVMALTNISGLTGVINPDDVQLAGTAVGQFADPTVGTNKVLTVTGASLTGTNAPNYLLDTNLPVTGSITKRRLILAGATAQDKFYDGTTTANLSGGVLTGIVAGEDVRLSATPTANFTTNTVGTNIAVNVAFNPGIVARSSGGGGGVTLTGVNAGNYLVVQPMGLAGNINPAPITVSNLAVVTRAYLGTNVVTATVDTNAATLHGVVSPDQVEIDVVNSVVNFQDGWAGVNKQVTIVSLVLTGADAAKYSLTTPTGLTGEITPKPLTLTGVSVAHKIYDGTPTATLSGAVVLVAGGVLGNDDVQLDVSVASANFANANVGTAKATTVTGYFLTGTKAANYTVTQPSGLTADITGLGAWVDGVVAEHKVYDGNTNAVLNLSNAILRGINTNDIVTLVTSNASGAFLNRHVGTSKPVTVSGFTLAGVSASNYTLTQPTNVVGNITSKALTLIGGITVSNRVYDSGDTAILAGTNGVLSGLVDTNDVVSLNLLNVAARFADPSAGTNKLVNLTGLALTGSDASNYALAPTNTVLADIAPLAVEVTGLMANSKIYDGGTNTTVAGSASFLVAGTTNVAPLGSDILSLNLSGALTAFVDRHAGTNKPVTVNGLALSGASAGNYTLNPLGGFTADITPLNLTVTGVTVSPLAYGAGTNATVAGGNLQGNVVGDDVSLDTNSVQVFFPDGLVGNGKPLLVSGYALVGTNASNYTLSQPALSGDIVLKILTVSNALALSKAYDGNTGAQIQGAQLVGVETNDIGQVNLLNAASGTFVQSSAGTSIAVTTAMTLGGAAAGNYSLAQPTNLTADITRLALQVTAMTASNRIYDGTTDVILNGGTLSGKVGSDDVQISGTATGTMADKHVGNNKAVTINGLSLTGGDSGNYTLDPVTGVMVTIDPKDLTVSGAVANDKEYDKQFAAVLSGANLIGVETNDTVAIANHTTGNFATNIVSNSIAVTTSMSLGGTDAGNYNLLQPTNLTANITPRQLSVINATVQSKVYDGNTAATVLTAALDRAVFGDDVSLMNHVSGTFASSAVGTNIVVTTAMSLTGTDAANYVLTVQPTLAGAITGQSLEISGLAALDRMYDGRTNVALNAASAKLVLSATTNEVTNGVSLDTNAAVGFLADKHVGTNKPVTVGGFGLIGVLASNYSLVLPTNITATITQRPVWVTNALAMNKTYDGTNNNTATITNATLVNHITNDLVELTNANTGLFVTVVPGGTNLPAYHAAMNVTVEAAMALSGADAGNYLLAGQPTLTADIEPRELQLISAVALDKQYDGTTLATVSNAAFFGVISGDQVVPANDTVGTFVTHRVGSGIAVTTAITVGGVDAANYILRVQPTLAANITPKALTISSVTANNRPFDGTLTTTLSGGSLAGVVSVGGVLDDVTLDSNAAVATFADSASAPNKAVTVSGYSLAGPEASNYTLTQPTGLIASILGLPLTVTQVTANNIIYNRATATTVSGGTLVGVQAGHTVTLDDSQGAGNFADALVGANKTVQVSGYRLAGPDAGRYAIIQPTTTADILPKILSVSGATAANKVYDKNTSAVVSGATLVGVLAPDVVSLANDTAGTFVQDAAGNGLTVTTGMTLTGADSANYNLAQPSLTANITPKPLTVTGAVAANKEYDKTAVATVSGATLSGLIAGDIVALTNHVTGTFSQVNVGTSLPVTTVMALTGTHAANYSVSQPLLTASITPKTLGLSGISVADKPYDQTTTATVAGGTIAGVISGDIVTLDTNGVTAVFASATVGAGKSVNLSGLALAGAEAGNYTLPAISGISGRITPLPITVTNVQVAWATNTNAVPSTLLRGKEISGSTSIGLDLSGAGLVGVLNTVTNDLASLSLGGTANFATAGVGTNKPVVTSLVLAGGAAGNYTLIQPTDVLGEVWAGSLSAGDDIVPLAVNSLGYTKMNIPLSTLLANDGLGNGNYAFSVSQRFNGYSADRRGNVVTITLSNGLIPGDVFEYTLTEDLDGNGSIGAGEQVTGKVTLQSSTNLAGTLSVHSSTLNGSNFEVVFVTMPGTRIQVQKTTSMSPANWVNVGAPMTADANGYVIYSEAISAGSGFFRAYRVP